MKLSGLQIAEHILYQLRLRVGDLQKKHVVPHLVVIFIGNDPASTAYIKQKQKQGESIGAKVTILQYDTSITTQELSDKIQLLNSDPFVHGILVQRPMPKHIDTQLIEVLIDPSKDIDGFHPDSPYTLPLPLAVIKILETIYEEPNTEQLLMRLKHQSIIILGKGEAGGKPIKKYFDKLGINHQVIDSKTHEPRGLIQNADIIISAVGKPGLIKAEDIKPDAILIGVGMKQGEGKKLHGDYNENEIQTKAAFYTPTPRGVGPVNVAMLMENLVTATERQTRT